MNEEIRQKIKEIVQITQIRKEWRPGIDYVQYAGPYFDGSELEDAIFCMTEGWLGLGDRGTRFENLFSPKLGKPHGVLVNSGSSANLLMVSALKSKRLYNLPEGSQIITAAAGFPTTVNPILQCGFKPIFVDIESNTLNIDPQKIEDAAKKNDARALIFAHVLGNSPNMNDIMYIVKKYNLILLEDCCDALDSKFEGKPLGSFGDMATCSFYPAHHITMGEGGFVACNTPEQETVLKSFRDWGRSCYCSGKASVSLKNGFCKKRFSNWIKSLPGVIFDHKYVYDEVGYNLKPLELQAAMGLRQLEKLKEITTKRKYNYGRLHRIFSKYPDSFKIHENTKGCDPSWFAFPVTVTSSKFDRIDLTAYFEDNKIQTRNYFAGNILLQPGYDHLEEAKNAVNEFPVSTHVMKNTFFLGTSPVITNEQLDYVDKKLMEFMSSRNT